MYVDLKEWGKDLVGKKFMVKQVAPFSQHWWQEAEVPIVVTKEYPAVLEVEVLSHKNHPRWPFMSYPYTQHLNKADILSGHIRLTEVA